MNQNSTDKKTVLNFVWRLRLFDGPILEDCAGIVVSRFRSRKVGALLSFLAIRLGRFCSREELCEALWPEEDSRVAANRLRVTLSSLRNQLEPAGVNFGTVLDVSQFGRICLRSDAVWCDVQAFEERLRNGDKTAAAQLARGELLTGYYDDWVINEQLRYSLLREGLRDFAPTQSPATEHSTPISPVNRQPSLPLYLTLFFGREMEKKQLNENIGRSRLVVLIGPGGIGKTRLAVEAANLSQKNSLFVSLSDVGSQCGFLTEAILDSLKIISQPEADSDSQLIEALLRRTPLILILDNADHLLDNVSSLSLSLLEKVPELHILITSRSRPQIPGETTQWLRALDLPSESTSLEKLLEYPAIALFIDRAKNARPDFRFSEKHIESVVEICKKLEGMPLALELAAARITAQSPLQIIESLNTNLMSLKSRQRGLSARHRSLRAAIQSSFDLLCTELKRFFAMLTVFVGGWTATAAREVTGCKEYCEYLEELVSCSLIQIHEEESTGILRYTFMEILRQFALEQLSDIDETQCLDRSSQYFLRLAAKVSEDDIRTLLPVDLEAGNLMKALERGVAHKTELYWEGMSGAIIHAFIRGRHRVAIGWIDTALKSFQSISGYVIRFQLRYAACLILPDMGRSELTETIALEMHTDAENFTDKVGVGFAKIIQGYSANTLGDMQTAVNLHRESLEIARGLQNSSFLQSSLSHLSGTLFDYGMQLGPDTDLGRRTLEEGLALALELKTVTPEYSRRIPLVSLLVCTTLLNLDRLQEGYWHLKETQRTSVALGVNSELMYSFLHECQVAYKLGFFETAALLCGAFFAIQEKMGYSLERIQAISPNWIRNIEGELKPVFGKERYDELIKEGRRMPIEEFVNSMLPI